MPQIKKIFIRRLNLGIRFVAFVMLVALLTGGAVSLMVIYTSHNSLRQEVLDSNLTQASMTAQFTAIYISSWQTNTLKFASNPTVRQAILNGTPQQAQTLLSQFVQEQWGLTGAAIYDANGIQKVYSTAGATSIGQSFMDRDYIQQVLATGKPYQGVAVVSRASGQLSSAYAVPVLDDQGKVRGIITGGISLTALSNAMVSTGFSKDTEPSIIDTRNGGLVIADVNPEHLMAQVSTKDEPVSRLLAGETGAVEMVSSTGEERLWAFAVVPNLPWGVMVTIPSSIALATVHTMVYNASIFTSLIVLLTAILGVLLMLGVSRPLVKMRDVSQKIALGDLAQRVNITQKSEVGDLAQSFNEMAESLQKQDHELKDHARLLENKVEERTQELARSNADLQQFAYVASHDLQEPLRMVSSYMQLLAKRYGDKLSGEAKEFMDYAVDGSNRMKTMINDLLMFSRVGTRGKSVEPADMNEVFALVSKNLEIAIAESQVELTRDDLSTIVADKTQMTELMQNLVANAIKFRNKETPKIHIGFKDNKEEWLFSVRDNGIGIDPEFSDRIFIIFQRLHTRDEYAGSGIGLSISKRIVERHGGKIWFESQKDKGTTFYFTISKNEGGKDVKSQS